MTQDDWLFGIYINGKRVLVNYLYSVLRPGDFQYRFSIVFGGENFPGVEVMFAGWISIASPHVP